MANDSLVNRKNLGNVSVLFSENELKAAEHVLKQVFDPDGNVDEAVFRDAPEKRSAAVRFREKIQKALAGEAPPSPKR